MCQEYDSDTQIFLLYFYAFSFYLKRKMVAEPELIFILWFLVPQGRCTIHTKLERHTTYHILSTFYVSFRKKLIQNSVLTNSYMLLPRFISRTTLASLFSCRFLEINSFTLLAISPHQKAVQNYFKAKNSLWKMWENNICRASGFKVWIFDLIEQTCLQRRSCWAISGLCNVDYPRP